MSNFTILIENLFYGLAVMILFFGFWSWFFLPRTWVARSLVTALIFLIIAMVARGFNQRDISNWYKDVSQTCQQVERITGENLRVTLKYDCGAALGTVFIPELSR